MKLLVTVVLALLLVSPIFAAESGDSRQTRNPGIEQIKAGVLQNLEREKARILDEIACVQAAADEEELIACKEKFRPAAPSPGVGAAGRGEPAGSRDLSPSGNTQSTGTDSTGKSK